MPDARFDIVVVGGGIVGLSTAMEATQRFPYLRLVILEKEAVVSSHQSSHNSGVIHSGIYYKPGSLKAQMCVEGAAAMKKFCQAHDIPHEICGKLIVATDDSELPRLEELHRRGLANGISGLTLLSREQLLEIEPNCSGIRALHAPGTGITDYGQVSRKYAELVAAQGGQILTGTKVIGLEKRGGEIIVHTNRGSVGAKYVINCAGLHSDKISRMSGNQRELMIIPFRGEYYELVHDSEHLVRGLIYPVPDPRFPFLGVHFTRRVTGGVEAGPNAVLAFSREGYRMGQVQPNDMLGMLSFPGFWRMGAKYWRTGLGEFHRSLSKVAFVRALQKLLPNLRDSDLQPGGSGVRAQAVRRDGTLVDDFQFVHGENILHVNNVPSPAATASIPIGKAIVRMAEQQFAIKPQLAPTAK
jgi:L-2-hydroxyglutarate oxidase